MAGPINELPRAERWLTTVLKADVTIAGLIGTRVYADVMPVGDDSAYPAIVFNLLSPGEDLLASGSSRVIASPVYLVKAINRGRSLQALQTLADRVDQVLHEARGGVTGAGIAWCKRIRPFSMREYEGQVAWTYLGGEYEIALYAT